MGGGGRYRGGYRGRYYGGGRYYGSGGNMDFSYVKKWGPMMAESFKLMKESSHGPLLKSFVVLAILSVIWCFLSFFQNLCIIFGGQFLAWTNLNVVEWSLIWWIGIGLGLLLAVVQAIILLIIAVHSVYFAEFIQKETFGKNCGGRFTWGWAYYYAYFRGGVLHNFIGNVAFIILSIVFYNSRWSLFLQITMTCLSGVMMFQFMAGVLLVCASLLPLCRLKEIEINKQLFDANTIFKVFPTYLLTDILLWGSIWCYVACDLCCFGCFSIMFLCFIIIILFVLALYGVSMLLKNDGGGGTSSVADTKKPEEKTGDVVANWNTANVTSTNNANADFNNVFVPPKPVTVPNISVPNVSGYEPKKQVVTNFIGVLKKMNDQQQTNFKMSQSNAPTNFMQQQNTSTNIKHVNVDVPDGPVDSKRTIYVIYEGKKKRITVSDFNGLQNEGKNRFGLFGNQYVYKTQKDMCEIENDGDFSEVKEGETIVIEAMSSGSMQPPTFF